MRILMTGSSPTQFGSDRTHKKFYGAAQGIRAVLEAMGHEVEQRPPQPEDIRMEGHDLIVSGIACIASMGGRYSNNIYWMLGQWEEKPFPLVMYADDWHLKPLHSTVRGIIKEPERIEEKSTALGRPTHAWAMEHRDEIFKGVEAINRGFRMPFLLHRFPWGDEQMMAEDGKVLDPWSVDISGYMPQWPFSTPDSRVEEWTCPRLQTLYDRWLDDVGARCKWPITRFGNQRKQEQVVTEDKIPQVICEAAGTLIPSGYHSGMGLWRSRYLIAAWTKTPMYAAPDEGVARLDPSLTVVPWAIELMGQSEREQLAKAQGDAILSRVWGRQQFADKMQLLLSTVFKQDFGLAPRVALVDAAPPRPLTERPRHPLLTPVAPLPVTVGGGPTVRQPREPRTVAERQPRKRSCCDDLELAEGAELVHGHKPTCPRVQPRAVHQPKVCECAAWELLADQGEKVRGHHPTCPRVQPRAPRQPREPSSNGVIRDQALRLKPGEDGYLVMDPPSGMWHRPGTLDYYVLREVKGYMAMGIVATDVVLDVGGHIGAFTVMAARMGAEVYTYEPDPENYAILEKNVAAYDGRVHTEPRALVSDGAEVHVLYQNIGANTGTHTLIATRGRDTVEVGCVDFQAVMAEVQPTVLKVDIEGWEYSLDMTIPPSVRVLCMELHRMKPGHREKADELAASILAQGFEPIKAPRLEGGAWAVLGIWRRTPDGS